MVIALPPFTSVGLFVLIRRIGAAGYTRLYRCTRQNRYSRGFPDTVRSYQAVATVPVDAPMAGIRAFGRVAGRHPNLFDCLGADKN